MINNWPIIIPRWKSWIFLSIFDGLLTGCNITPGSKSERLKSRRPTAGKLLATGMYSFLYPIRYQLQLTVPALANGHFGMQMLLPCFLSMTSNFGGLSLKSQVVLFAGHLLICMMPWESARAEELWMVTSAVICNGIILVMFVMRRHYCRSEYDSCPNLILLFFLFMVLVMSGIYSSSNKATSEDKATSNIASWYAIFWAWPCCHSTSLPIENQQISRSPLSSQILSLMLPQGFWQKHLWQCTSC